MSYPTEGAAFFAEWKAIELAGLVGPTLTDATAGTLRADQAAVTIAPTGGTIAISGSVVPIRGALTVDSGDAVTAGFLYGVQGKLILDGATIAVGSNHVAGVYAQISAAAATLTSGHIAGLIVSGQNLPGSAAVDMIYCESGGTPINSCFKTIVDAEYVFDLAEQNDTQTMLNHTSGQDKSGGTKGGWLRVNTKGGIRFLQLYI